MSTIMTSVILSLVFFGQTTVYSFNNGNTNTNFEEPYDASTFISEIKILIKSIIEKKIEVKKTDYIVVADILGLEADEYLMSKTVEYDNDMMLNISCPVRKKFSYVKTISFQFTPVFDTKNIEYEYISSYLKDEFGKPKETLNDSIIWEFNEQKITLTKETVSLNFSIEIESLINEE